MSDSKKNELLRKYGKFEYRPSMFWTPDYADLPSAWLEHGPFAFWLVDILKPKKFVELGTHYGFSYFCFCQAVEKLGRSTSCTAIDTWKGDEHAGRYDDSVFESVVSLNQRYKNFSNLVRSTFDAALEGFSSKSIDLLHIDGSHFYRDVKHDYESWLPKLTENAIVIFHDTAVRENDFGVWKFFDELKSQHACYEFTHGYGLGIVSIGEIPTPLKKLFSSNIAETRETFLSLGAAVLNRYLLKEGQLEVTKLSGQLKQAKERQVELSNDLQRSNEVYAELFGELKQERDLRAELSKEMKRATEKHAEVLLELKQMGEKREMEEAQSRKYRQLFEIRETRSSKWALLKSVLTKSNRQAEKIRKSGYFDGTWYLANNPDVAVAGIDPSEHYLNFGWLEGREPSPIFSGNAYLASNKDVADAKINPLLHFIEFGEAENRNDAVTLQVNPKSTVTETALISGNTRNNFSILFVSSEYSTPGNVYRVERFVDTLNTIGYSATWMRMEELAGRMSELSNFDALVIWRVSWNSTLAQAVSIIRSRGMKVIFDVDDLMIDPKFARIKLIDGIRSQFLKEKSVGDHYSKVRETMLAADLCITTTDELAFHMRLAGKPTFVVPNGFDHITLETSRAAARSWLSNRDDLIRIGYAGGSRTHQRDLSVAIEAIAKILTENTKCRLVLFRSVDGLNPLVDIHEFKCMDKLHEQVEWRPLQKLADLPNELARFDINLAPLEVGNVFCEAKSELKFFEAALVSVPTIASPTGPYRRAIEHGKTGFLAATADDWYTCLSKLIDDSSLRESIALKAYHSSLANFGPLKRQVQLGCVVDQLEGGFRGARAFALSAQLSKRPYLPPMVHPYEIAFSSDQKLNSKVTVVVPLFNYEQYIEEALNSVAGQTLQLIDLIVVDDCSTDNSLKRATNWAKKNIDRFNRLLVLRNRHNCGLAHTRNCGFSVADTTYVLPLDADNRLLPLCCERLLEEIEQRHSGYVYSTIQCFGDSKVKISDIPYIPQRFVAGNHIDAMALIAKETWAFCGGYENIKFGWEDYDFWCRIAELGISGHWHNEVLCEYRVHKNSMLRTQTTAKENYLQLMSDFTRLHPWVALIDREQFRSIPDGENSSKVSLELDQLDKLLQILKCPITGQKLRYGSGRKSLITFDGMQKWNLVEGRPLLIPGVENPLIMPSDHISNELPAEAIAIIKGTTGLVLNLSAGGSEKKFDNVIEVEFAVFRNTDVLADAHNLPFDDNSFEAIVVMNAFEHYRGPSRVARELFRVLRPGGRIHIRTAFLQPLHEPPHHFYNCTRFGLEEWFKDFTTDRLHVSENFSPGHSISWLASEAEIALRGDVSAESSQQFMETQIGELVDAWRDSSKRNNSNWTNLSNISDTKKEVIAAGFEFFGHKPNLQ
jgi:glycosyltransferase involved in cell wall biosynthesis/predicted SAM-dependent methyltransferase